ncbi:6255_t:CDS:2, partial [Gigaspora margarita]
IKDWMLVEKKENSMIIRRVVKKKKREVLVEHWQDKNVILKRDKMEQEEIQGVYPKIQNIANQKVLPVSKELTVEASLARHLVKSQVLNKTLFLDLLEALEQNTLNRKEVYKFYTDGSLSSQGVMGASWVQISLEHNIVVAKGSIRLSL